MTVNVVVPQLLVKKDRRKGGQIRTDHLLLDIYRDQSMPSAISDGHGDGHEKATAKKVLSIRSLRA